jgi:hypothetical protein
MSNNGPKTFSALKAAPTTAAAARSTKKAVKDMNPDEKKKFYQGKHRQLVETAQAAHDQAGGSKSQGKRPVKMWEADVSKLVHKVDDKGTLIVEYNHGTKEKPDVHKECYITPLCHITGTGMLSGAGVYYESKTEPKPPSTKDWAHMCNLNLGLQYPQSAIDANPNCVDEQQKSMQFFLVDRPNACADFCIDDPSVYPHHRDGAEEAVKNAQSFSPTKLTDEQKRSARRKYWLTVMKMQTKEIKDETNDSVLFHEISLKSKSFFPPHDIARRKPLSQEVIDVLESGTADERKLKHAMVIKQAYDEGYDLTRVYVVDLDGNPIQCSVFSSPVHDTALVQACFSVFWYQDGTNRGATYNPAKIGEIEKPKYDRTNVDLGTTVYAQKIKERTPHEIAVLTHAKACAAPEGLDLVELIKAIGNKSTTEQITAAIKSLTKDQLIKEGKTEMFIAIVNPSLDIAALPVKIDEQTNDPAESVVAKARRMLDEKIAAEKKKKEEEDEKARQAKEKEEAEQKLKQTAAQVAAAASSSKKEEQQAVQQDRKRNMAALTASLMKNDDGDGEDEDEDDSGNEDEKEKEKEKGKAAQQPLTKRHKPGVH